LGAANRRLGAEGLASQPGQARRTLDPAKGASSSVKSDNYVFAGGLASVI
jgi:hypothetical protein